MDRDEMIRILYIERECISRDCDRNCSQCDLVQEKDHLLEVYDGVIQMLDKGMTPRVKIPDMMWSCRNCYSSFGANCKYCPECGTKIKWSYI